MKELEDDIQAKIKTVNEAAGIKESDTGLAIPALWDLAADKQALQTEEPLQVGFDSLSCVCVCVLGCVCVCVSVGVGVCCDVYVCVPVCVCVCCGVCVCVCMCVLCVLL